MYKQNWVTLCKSQIYSMPISYLLTAVKTVLLLPYLFQNLKKANSWRYPRSTRMENGVSRYDWRKKPAFECKQRCKRDSISRSIGLILESIHSYTRWLLLSLKVSVSIRWSVGPSHINWISEKWHFRTVFEQNSIRIILILMNKMSSNESSFFSYSNSLKS